MTLREDFFFFFWNDHIFFARKAVKSLKEEKTCTCNNSAMFTGATSAELTSTPLTFVIWAYFLSEESTLNEVIFTNGELRP